MTRENSTSHSVQVRLNGTSLTVKAEASLQQMLEQLGLAEKRVAVECNGAIVPRSAYGQYRVRAGDHLEIVVAVGGG